MTTFNLFALHLQACLRTSPHVIFEHFLLDQSIVQQLIHILWQEEEESTFTKLRSFSDLQGMVISKKKEGTLVTTTFKDGTDCQLYFMIKVFHQKKIFLNASTVLSHRQLSSSGKSIPNIEHLFEFGVLYHFLNNKGINSSFQNHFEGFHFFIKEGLLEFFNDKYNTSFTSMDVLTTYSEKEKLNMLETIKLLPDNRLLHQMNVRWSNLLGYLRQAKF